MKYRLLLFLAILSLSACKSRQYSRNNKQIEKTANKANPNYTSYTTLTYIDQFKDVAIEEMNLYGIPASITLAQGIIESGSGNSGLAKFANNHFGVKCTSDWKGKAYYKDDDQHNDCFRVYKDARESYKDHSEFLKRKRYSALFELDKNDYKNWAKGLKQAGYASNPKYPDLLINLIEKYNLDQYDQPESETQKINREDRVFTEINANIPVETKKFTPVEEPPSKKVIVTVQAPSPPQVPSPPAVDKVISTIPSLSTGSSSDDKFYIVKKGDTLYNLSKRYNLTVDELKDLNHFPAEGIQIGQKIQVIR
jgi:LysM repeat protein